MKCFGVRFFVVTLFAAACVGLSAQQDIPHETRSRTFASPEGTFRFNYPAALVSCQKRSNETVWLPDDCNAYTPVCSNFSCDSTGTVACIAYPANEMKGSNFEAAAFSVSELKHAGTEAECLKVDEPPPHVGQQQYETVNGVRFERTETDGVGLGNLIDGYVYRAFHKGKCYELDIRIAYWNPANADPGTVKDCDIKAVHDSLKRVLSTFKFVH
jgi:hypothetical protein